MYLFYHFSKKMVTLSCYVLVRSPLHNIQGCRERLSEGGGAERQGVANTLVCFLVHMGVRLWWPALIKFAFKVSLYGKGGDLIFQDLSRVGLKSIFWELVGGVDVVRKSKLNTYKRFMRNWLCRIETTSRNWAINVFIAPLPPLHSPSMWETLKLPFAWDLKVKTWRLAHMWLTPSMLYGVSSRLIFLINILHSFLQS